jgi:hypothetical protein
MKFGFFLKKYSYVIGLIVFVIILSKTNLGEIFQNIKNIKLSYLLFALLLTIPTFINKAFCWNYIKRKQGIKYGLKDSFLMYCSGLYLGLITPGRLGEISKAIYLKKDGHSMGKSLVGVILDRLTDFAILIPFALIGSLFFFGGYKKESLIVILGIIALLILFWISVKTGLFRWCLKIIFNKLVPLKYRESWKINFQDFISDIKKFKIEHWAVMLLISVFSWAFYYLQMYVLAKGVGINVPFLYLAITVTVAGLITLIPVSISGIGTRDIALIMLLSPFLVTREQIIAFSALILLMVIWGALIGLICWSIKPIRA